MNWAVGQSKMSASELSTRRPWDVIQTCMPKIMHECLTIISRSHCQTQKEKNSPPVRREIVTKNPKPRESVRARQVRTPKHLGRKRFTFKNVRTADQHCRPRVCRVS